MKKFLPIVLAIFILASGCITEEVSKIPETPVPTMVPKISPLVDVAWVEAHLNDPNVRIVDVSQTDLAYESGHIPNAVFLNWRTDISDQREIERFIVAQPEQIEKVLGRLGVGKDTTVVLYDNFKNSLAVKVYQELKYYGHENIAILNGGADAWKNAGKSLTTDDVTVNPTEYKITKTDSKMIVDINYVKANLNKPGFIPMDARGQAMYNGSIPGKTFHTQKEYPKRGHIPGAVNVFWQTNLNPDGTFKSLDELRAMYEAKGVTKDKDVATYCNEGIFAAYDWFVLHELLGYEKVAVYEGSMIEWSGDPATITMLGNEAVGEVYVAAQAKAELINAQGEKIGTAMFTGVNGGVKIALDAANLPAGEHGYHIHAVGKCEPANFTSAGGHFNPFGKKHGVKSPDGPHAGDMPNLVVGQDGTVKTEVTAALVTLGEGINSLFDADASALVIHSGPDDEMTDPTGNSGARIACGVITK